MKPSCLRTCVCTDKNHPAVKRKTSIIDSIPVGFLPETLFLHQWGRAIATNTWTKWTNGDETYGPATRGAVGFGAALFWRRTRWFSATGHGHGEESRCIGWKSDATRRQICGTLQPFAALCSILKVKGSQPNTMRALLARAATLGARQSCWVVDVLFRHYNEILLETVDWCWVTFEFMID